MLHDRKAGEWGARPYVGCAAGCALHLSGSTAVQAADGIYERRLVVIFAVHQGSHGIISVHHGATLSMSCKRGPFGDGAHMRQAACGCNGMPLSTKMPRASSVLPLEVAKTWNTSKLIPQLTMNKLTWIERAAPSQALGYHVGKRLLIHIRFHWYRCKRQCFCQPYNLLIVFLSQFCRQ